jgi:hypothetical protein
VENKLARWSPLSGIAFVVLYVTAGVLFDDEPGPGASDHAILAYYRDDGNQLKLEVAFLLATFAGVFFIWFAGTLSARLRAAEAEGGWLSRIPLISGAAFAVLTVSAAALYQFVADAVDDNPDRFEVDPDTARLLTNGAYTLSPEAAFPLAAPLVLAASLVFLRTRLTPRWFGRAGFVVALGCLLGFLGATSGLFLLWVVVVAVLLMRSAPSSAGAPTPARTPS